ncbi:MAG: phosphate ABC transporter substrate-binding protein [Acidobacteriota bacterium]|nr:phosphate ABC transporter substrate-binding protein [Acidobacteriota bacterium]
MGVIGSLVMCLVFGALALPDAVAQGRGIGISGSDTLVMLGQRWAEIYMKKNPGVRLQVSGGGSGVGIAALINGSTDIAESSRPIKDAEKAQLKTKRNLDAVELPVALDGLAVYVHDSNPVRELTLEQLKKIYTGAVTNWKDVGGKDGRILLYGRENSSGTYAYFKEHVLADADYHPTTQTLPGTAAVISAVAKDARGIGYGGIAYLKGVRAVKVKKDAASPGIEPTLDNVQKNIYPISRLLYWYFAGAPTGQIKQLADWVVSADGQAVVTDVGYYPLPAHLQGKGKLDKK